MQQIHDFDVVISGYGPTGLAAASLLARRGHRVCVFERWPALYGLPRMATIDGETARIIQAACDDRAAFRNSLPRSRYVFANGQGEILIDHKWAGTHVSGHPFRISLHQPDIEDAMDAAARAAGAEINQGWEVVALSQDDAAARITARRRDAEGDAVTWGPERSVTARYVIGADGARSAVRTALGIAREPWPYRNAWYSVDTRRKRTLPNLFGISPDAQVAAIICAPLGRAHSIIPLGADVVRFNLEVDPDADHGDKLNRAAAYRFLGEVYGLTEDDVEVYRQAIYPFEGQLAAQWRHGRAFLAGDAAHLMTPFQGQGGCSALRDAINLAWKLDLVLNGVAGEAILDSYQTERLPHARIHIGASDKLAALAFVHDPDKAAERDRLFLEGRAPSPPPDPVLTDGILQRRDGGLAAPVGDVGPQGVISRGGRRGRGDDVAGFGFQLILLDADPAAQLDAGQRAFLDRIGCALVGVGEGNLWRDEDGAYRRFCEAHGIAGFLLRPDFVVFGVVHAVGEIGLMVDDLRHQLG